MLGDQSGSISAGDRFGDCCNALKFGCVLRQRCLPELFSQSLNCVCDERNSVRDKATFVCGKATFLRDEAMFVCVKRMFVRDEVNDVHDKQCCFVTNERCFVAEEC